VGSGLPAGSQLFGPGAGKGTFQGAQPAYGIGQTFGPLAGRITAATAQVGLTIGIPGAFGPAPGLIAAFGYPAGLATGVSPIPAPPAAAFAPTLSELGIDIWERVGVQANQLTVTHLASMRRSMNLVLARWANRGVNLWRVAQSSVTLQQGVATYPLAITVIEMLDSYISATNASDRVITPVSRATYAALPNKLTQGMPTIMWFDRTITPSVTLWPVPDGSATYTLNYFTLSQVGDMDPAMGQTPAIPYRFLEAYCAGVAAMLAQKYTDPQRAIALDGYAKETFSEATMEDVERVTSTLVPDFSGYLD
jgi:hypothetical protein